MRKIRIRRDLSIPGWGPVRKGTEFRVARFNSRFVYVELRDRVVVRLARKGDCETVY